MDSDLIMTLLNCSVFYVVILDKDMKIRFINDSLSNRLGFDSKDNLIDRCWLDFIPEINQEKIKKVFYSILYHEGKEYSEYVNTLVDVNQLKFEVKWFNTSINHDTYWIFSFGLPHERGEESTREEMRENFRDRLASDRTLIRSLQDHVTGFAKQIEIDESCNVIE
jgi:hypothetical protein